MPKQPALLSTYASLFLGKPSRRRIERFRNHMLRRLVRHAYRRVPHYRDAFKSHGVHPDDIAGVGDLHKLPVLERRTLQEEPLERLLADGVDPKRLGTRWSSGSTGIRISVHRTRFESHVLNAARLRVEWAIGRRPGMRLAGIGLIRERPHGDRPTWWRRAARTIGFGDVRRIDCLQDPQQIIEQLRADPPDMLGGFPGILLRIADAAGPDGLEDLGVKVLITGGEVSTPVTRERIAKAFGARVNQRYGSIEFNLLASQCPETDFMHVCDRNVIVELAHEGRSVGDGEAGEVIATGLHGYAKPLIRYRIGDVATPGPTTCPCGAPHATIRSVQGRMIEHLRMPDGRVVHPWAFTMPLHGANRWMSRYRLTQERLDLLRLEVVPRQAPAPDQLDAIQELCHRIFHPAVTITVELVDDIPLEPSGKYRVVRSLVKPGPDAT